MKLALTVLLAFRAVGATGAEHDDKSGKLRTRGAAAVDLAAPSADVARVRAEKQARALCEKRLRAALLQLGTPEAQLDELVGKLVVKKVDYMADGAVVMDAELDTKAAKASNNPEPKK